MISDFNIKSLVVFSDSLPVQFEQKSFQKRVFSFLS